MLDADTKRRIDTARDILVGKVPDPKSQVEQITIALIYKFMDDMDAEAEEFGGKRKFFADGFARYGWVKLMRSGLGGHETLNLYAEAITRMPENPGIPLLFRDIFKNAYLPYRDPETLRAFLKIIDGDRGVNYPKKEDFSSEGYCLFLNTKNVRPDGFNFSEMEFIPAEKDLALRKGRLQRGDVVLTTRGTVGNTGFYDESVEFENVRINSGMLIFRPDQTRLSGEYLFLFFQSQNFTAQRDAIISGTAQPQLPIRSLNEARLPLPDLAVQQEIVDEIDAEQALVAANRELIQRFEKKIQAAIARVWGEES